MKPTFPNEVAIYGETKTPNETPTVNKDATTNQLKRDHIDQEAPCHHSIRRSLPVYAGNLHGPTYERYFVRFSKGTPKQWLALLND